jgi:nickel superoxide dismutase
MYMNPVRFSLRLLDKVSQPATVHAHCDIPCGIYDPHLAQIAALTCIRMNQLIEALEAPGGGTQVPSKEERDKYMNSLARYIATKEEHAELAKREVRVIWGDYFKPEHLEKAPDLHQTVWNIMKLGGTVRQQVNAQAANDLMAEVQKFAEAFWASKGVSTRKVASNTPAGGELVVPA